MRPHSPAAKLPLTEGDLYPLVPPRQEYGCVPSQRPQQGLHSNTPVCVSSWCCSLLKLRVETSHTHTHRSKALSQPLFHSLNQIYRADTVLGPVLGCLTGRPQQSREDKTGMLVPILQEKGQGAARSHSQ